MAHLMKMPRRLMSIDSKVIKHVTVVGSGLMGSGIAQVAAQNGLKVTLVDLSQPMIDKAKKSIEKSLERVAKKQFKDDQSKIQSFVHDTSSRISTTTNVEEAAKDTDLVIEAIIEKLSEKQKLFSAIDAIAKPSAIFASNTSSISIADIAKGSSRSDRFCGLHFFNPVPVMKLLEIIRIPETSDDTFNTVKEFGTRLGKACITCKDTPGFVVNRLLVPYLAEAVRMLDRGDATARDIDIAMKLGAGYPMGPFELADYVGLDTTKYVLEVYAKAEPENPLFKPVKLLDKLVGEGKLGLKTGKGFYEYTKK